MNIYEIYPGKYSVSEIGHKTLVFFLVYDSRDKYSQCEPLTKDELKPYHRVIKFERHENTLQKRIAIFDGIFNYETKSYSSILR